MTLDACAWLDKKHTIFGKIEGATLYNLVKLGELETDGGDRPVSDPIPTIIKALVLESPFDDIIPRNITRVGIPKQIEIAKPIQNLVKNSTALLSF